MLIEETDKKITELEEKNKELIAYYQVMLSNNVYMEFITESSNMTELIMRSDAVKELTNYQQERLKKLEDLIKENEQLQVDMKKYQVTLEKNIIAYQDAVYSLQDNLSDLNDIAFDIPIDYLKITYLLFINRLFNIFF